MRRHVWGVSSIAMIWFSCAGTGTNAAAQSSAPSSSTQILEQQANSTLRLEATYREIDYSYLPSNEEGYLRALQIAETNAVLSAIYRYARYSENTFQRFTKGRQILVPLLDQSRISQGLIVKRRDMEGSLRNNLDRNVFDWRRSLWITRMANYAAALSAIDRHLESEKDKTKKAELKGERDLLLQDEPILATKVAMPFDAKDRRPVYAMINDLYQRVSEDDLTCVAAQRHCLAHSVLQWKEEDLEALRENVKHERKWIEDFGERALSELFSLRTRQIYRGQPFVPVEVVREVLATFPGGEERYFALLDEVRNESDESRFLHALRDRIAFEILEPALEKSIQSLKEDLLRIPDRTFADFAPLPALREAVISSLPGGWRGAAKVLDREMIRAERRDRRVRRAEDIAFVVAIGASLYFFPPAAGLAMFSSPMVWTRVAATGLHAYSMVNQARHTADLANLRTLSGLGSYEWAALAESQFRMAVLFAYLDVFLPLRIGGSVRPMLSKISQGLGRFASNPLAKEEILEYSIGARNPIRLIFQAAPRGAAMVRRISQNTWEAWKEMGRLAALTGKGELRAAATLLPKTTVSKALLNSGASGLIMVATERIARGPKFYQEVGMYRNILITLLIDGATGFYGLGTFSTLEKMSSIGGTIFTMSIVGQLLTGVSDPKSLGLRGLGESAYCVTLSPWKIVFADQLAGKVAALHPGWPLWNHGTFWTIFLANNAIGNLVYSYGTQSLFEFSDPPRNSPWWVDRRKPFDRLRDGQPPRIAQQEDFRPKQD